jgi:hypothetical protein
MSADDPFPRERLMPMQIIAVALPLGVVSFFGVALYIVYGGGNPGPVAANRLPILTMMAGVFLLITGSLSFVVPGIMTRTVLAQIAGSGGQGDVVRLFGFKQTTMIVGMALLEGAAFFGLIAFIVERQPAVLAVPALALAGILLRFPTENSVRDWIEQQGRRVLELRQDRQS